MWIKADEQVPPDHREVLCWVPLPTGGGCYVLASYWWFDEHGPGGKDWQEEGIQMKDPYRPSHWMPLEKPE